MWVYPLSLSSGSTYLISSYDQGYFELSVGTLLGSNFITFKITNTTGGILTNTFDITASLQVGTWTHIAWQFDNSLATNKYRLFINGSRYVIGGGTSNTTATDKVFHPTMGFCLGARYNAGLYGSSFNGYIDEFRVSATARYNPNGFTALTTQFTTDANTVLLNRMESMYLYNSQIAPTTTSNIGIDIDDGSVLANNGIYTRYGNVEARASDSCLKLNNNTVLTSTTLGSSVVNSSLTSVGSLSSLTVAGALSVLGSLSLQTHSYQNYNVNASGGGTKNITFTESGLYLIFLGRNYNDHNIFYTIWLTLIYNNGTGKTGSIYVSPSFSVNINGISNGFSINASYPSSYNSFQVEYLKFG
jgi:hypothetical protein